jgi:signal transduction histidine kinase
MKVSVENDRSTHDRPGLSGTGRGLSGLRERVQEQAGHLLVGPAPHGGWHVQATLPK